MWYRQAREFNLYGQPIGDSPKTTRQYKTKRFQSTDEDLDVSAEPLEVEENETPLPEETAPETPEPAPVEEPQQVAPIRDIPLGADGQIAAPEQEIPNFPLPGQHEHCHCSIKTMPGGRRIWDFSDNACEECKNNARIFNSMQAQTYGI